MSVIPNFSKVPFSVPASLPEEGATQTSTTPEGVDVKSYYDQRDRAGLDFSHDWPGLAPFLRGPYPDHVRRPALDGPPVCRLLHRRGIRTPSTGAISPPARRGFRSPSISRPTAATIPIIRAWRGDVGMAGVAIDSIYDMRTLFAGIPLDTDERVDDHERRGAAGAGALHRRRRGTGRAAGQAFRHDPERHPERVHGPQHLHLPAGALDADRLRHLRLHGARTCRSSTRSRSPAITCRRPARRRTSSSPTRSPTASSISAPGSRPA